MSSTSRKGAEVKETPERCKYKFCDGKSCEGKVETDEYCALHADFPPGDKRKGYSDLAKLKKDAVGDKVKQEAFNFEGAKLLEIDLSGKKSIKYLNFRNAIIQKSARARFFSACHSNDCHHADEG